MTTLVLSSLALAAAPPVAAARWIPSADTSWQIQFTGTPELDVSWYPEQLLFVARGAAPYAIGYGRAQTASARFDAQELIETAVAPDAQGHREVPRATAQLGPVQTVGDPSVLEPRREPPALRTIALWGVLVAAVAIVLALSVRLLRRMGPA